MKESGKMTAEYRTPDGFWGRATAVPAVVADEMRDAKVWKEGCPVSIEDLNYLVLTHWGYDGRLRVGELVVHKELALTILRIFADLFSDRFPIEKMERIEKYQGDDDLSMAANNTSAFNCREATGKPGCWSRHSYGMAVDVNPLQNPYVAPKSSILEAMGWDGKEARATFLHRRGFDGAFPVLQFCLLRPDDCHILPPAALAYCDRSRDAPGMLLPESRAVQAFTNRGFDWGGAWQRLLDCHHFEYVGK